MEIERRALYNSLRMAWLLDPKIAVEQWQVEDYRALSSEQLFSKLKEKEIQLDKVSFQILSENFETPEDFTDDLIADSDVSPKTEDQIYLIVFELWRRIITDKPCLSVFCDELDHLIYQYDRGDLNLFKSIEDAIANLAVILDANVDEGVAPKDVFSMICKGCANDLETFLYDFITEQIELKNTLYAADLIESFSPYVLDVKWFDFLKGQIFADIDDDESHAIIIKLVAKAVQDKDIEFNLELLAFMIKKSNEKEFAHLVKQTSFLMEEEADFQDLLTVCIDYYHRIDKESKELAIQSILKKRIKKDFEDSFSPKDPDLKQFLNVIDD